MNLLEHLQLKMARMRWLTEQCESESEEILNLLESYQTLLDEIKESMNHETKQ